MRRQLVRGSLKFLASLVPFSRRARIAAFLLPRKHWYRFAVFASRLQGRVKALTGGNGPLTEAVMLDNWIRALTFSGSYPIPWQPGDTEVFSQIRPGQGVLYCWSHVPLVEVPLRAILDLGHNMDLIVAHPGKIENGDEFVVPGLDVRVKAISANKRVLTKVRTALAQGKSVACLVDAEIFGPMSPQVLGVAGMAGAFVIFQWAERLTDGTLKVTFQAAPHPFCKNDVEIKENLEFLCLMNRKTFAELGVVRE